MKVKELIKELEKFNQDLDVFEYDSEYQENFSLEKEDIKQIKLCVDKTKGYKGEEIISYYNGDIVGLEDCEIIDGIQFFAH